MRNLYKYLPIFLLILFSCKPDKNSTNTGPYLTEYSISSIVIDKSNNKWIGTNNGLYEGSGTNFSLQDISIPGKILSLFYEKGLNTLWVGTNAGLSKLELNGSAFISSIVPLKNLSNDTVQTIYVDSTSKRWFGGAVGITMNSNSFWKKDSFSYSLFSLRLLPLSIEITGINSISSWDGDYYFATNTYGLWRAGNFQDSIDAFTGATQWSIPYNGNALSDTMFVVFADSKGRIWMGGTNGLQFHTGHNSKSNTSSFTTELPNLRVHAIAEAANGDIWVGTENGLVKYDGSNWTPITSTLPSSYVTAIAFDSNGSTWVGTSKGLANIKY
jgi:ligand-binding sensor domain-containing protein